MNPKKIDRKKPCGLLASKVNGWYIAGLFNTDKGFSLHFVKNKESKFKYRIIPILSLTEHKDSINV
jgi:hypothetical protein